ncbi:MAG: nucleotidyl transferase AbiEii/AbiGii toxin family protein [Saprospiraceae bacterium]|nr:nucleotidyl transferase AbiEii/AbiGii toxin family protein [Saprospiraceae bacterium]
MRRNAVQLHSDNSTKFTIDISKYEYVTDKRAKDIEGAVVYVYSPEMLALEKLRALCQQLPIYKGVVFSMTPRSRARDFYDVYNLTEAFSINFKLPGNIELCKFIFDAKRVPMTYISLLPDQREFHRQSWESVINTVNQNETLKDFDYYFDYMIVTFKHLF